MLIISLNNIPQFQTHLFGLDESLVSVKETSIQVCTKNDLIKIRIFISSFHIIDNVTN